MATAPSSTSIPPGVTIWWGAYVGMPQQITLAGPLAQTGPQIVNARTEARESRLAGSWTSIC